MPKRVIERTPGSIRVRVWVAILASLLGAPAAALAVPGGGKSGATITGSFADSCRAFVAHSSKDISHVEVHYVDGRVVKDESSRNPDHAIDGAAGDEIYFAIVKSGTTSEQFDCQQSNRAPTARLEIQTPPFGDMAGCYDFWAGGLACEQSSPRPVWTGTSAIPDDGGSQSGILTWSCGGLTPHSECLWTMTFRVTGSSDPDGDIASWSLDFGDGTSVSGSWGTAPPAEVAHEFVRDASGNFSCTGVVSSTSGVCIVTLTVTDSAGQSHSEAMPIVFVDHTPD
jgi:hypothetical protein